MSTDADLRRYLLGDLPDDTAGAIERDYLAREASLEAVAEAERALIEDHLSGRLDPATRALFETRYLASPAHRRRVAIAKELRGRVAVVARGRGWSPWALAAVLAIGLAGIVWRLQAPGGGATPVVAITLPAVVVRGEGGVPTLILPAGAAMVDLGLERGDSGPCEAPEIAVRTVEGAEVWRGPAVVANDSRGSGSGAVTVAHVPARLLPDGDYVVLLTCAPGRDTPQQRSSFRVVRR